MWLLLGLLLLFLALRAPQLNAPQSVLARAAARRRSDKRAP
jgi:hypothetical protein